jgi:hypothetical protein
MDIEHAHKDGNHQPVILEKFIFPDALDADDPTICRSKDSVGDVRWGAPRATKEAHQEQKGQGRQDKTDQADSPIQEKI